MITFETEKEFMDAVMAVLVERLDVSVYVSKKASSDFYSRAEETEVEVVVEDTKSNDGCIAFGVGRG